MTEQVTGSVLARLSEELAGVVERVGPAVVRVDDGSRFTATGTVWSEDTVVSTSHGVERDEELAIETEDGTRLAAALVGRDADTDLSVLRVEAGGLATVEKAPPDGVKAGHLALAMGRPGASGLQATIGIISARLDSETAGRPEYLLTTDAVLYPGFSGGPLVDVSGRVVGITNRMYGRGKGMAVGLPIVERVVRDILAHGRVPRGYLGVRSQPVALPTLLRQSLGLEQETAVMIVNVEAGSPAEAAGLLLGDTLLALNGSAVTDVEVLRDRLRDLSAGTTVTFGILRGGQLREMPVTLGSA